MDDFCVVAGPSSKEIAKKMAEELRARLVDVEYKKFPDGENYVRISEPWIAKFAVLVQTTSPPQDSNLMQLFLISDLLREMGSRVVAVVPYLAYARQHRMYLNGEAISVRTVAKLLEASGVVRFLTVDIHNVEGLGYFSIPANSLSAVPVLAEYVKSNVDTSNLIAIAPDEGAKVRVETFATRVGCDYLIMEKSRDRVTGKVSSHFKGEVQLNGKNAIIVDDLISTGGSIAEASRILKMNGVADIRVACTHAVLADSAASRMKEAGVKEIIATDTIPSQYSKVSVSHLLSDFIRRL
ncbi:MAG: ribose-phosphate pyrophosphokinase [Conexivisphaerales archaeon]